MVASQSTLNNRTKLGGTNVHIVNNLNSGAADDPVVTAPAEPGDEAPVFPLPVASTVPVAATPATVVPAACTFLPL